MYFGSTLQNGASEKSFFESPFEWPSAPPSIGTEIYVPSDTGRCFKGVVGNDIRHDRALARTEMSTEDMRDFLKGWKEVSSWLD
jgi:hypothetical protein